MWDCCPHWRPRTSHLGEESWRERRTIPRHLCLNESAQASGDCERYLTSWGPLSPHSAQHKGTQHTLQRLSLHTGKLRQAGPSCSQYPTLLHQENRHTGCSFGARPLGKSALGHSQSVPFSFPVPPSPLRVITGRLPPAHVAVPGPDALRPPRLASWRPWHLAV